MDWAKVIRSAFVMFFANHSLTRNFKSKKLNWNGLQMHTFGPEHRFVPQTLAFWWPTNMEKLIWCNDTSIRTSSFDFPKFVSFHIHFTFISNSFHIHFTVSKRKERRVRQLKWLAIWDLSQNLNFGDIYIPDGFEPPGPQRISQFARLSNSIRSDPVVILNSKTIKVPNFTFDGFDRTAHFCVGNGPQPNGQGKIIPNERGYIEPLGTVWLLLVLASHFDLSLISYNSLPMQVHTRTKISC